MVKKTTNPISRIHIALTMCLIVLSIVCMIADYRGKMTLIRDVIQTYYSFPIKTASAWPEKLSNDIALFLKDKMQLQQENTQLKRQITWLKANLANQTVLEAEYRRLKKLLDSTANRTRPVMIAEVLDSQINANKHQIEINKGLLSSVFNGQVVIDENGVIGQVTQTNTNSATVTLITDERQRIPVFVERNRLRMVARGSGDLSELEMQFVNKQADVRVGDKIVTSGLGARYPRGYSIGIVSAVDNTASNEFMQVSVKPLAALDRILEVLLVSPVNDELSSPPSEVRKTDDF